MTWLAVATVLSSDSPSFSAVAATALVYLVLVGTALPIGLGLAAEQAASPFVIAASVLSGVIVVLSWALLRRWWPNRPRLSFALSPPDEDLAPLLCPADSLTVPGTLFAASLVLHRRSGGPAVRAWHRRG